MEKKRIYIQTTYGMSDDVQFILASEVNVSSLSLIILNISLVPRLTDFFRLRELKKLGKPGNKVNSIEEADILF